MAGISYCDKIAHTIKYTIVDHGFHCGPVEYDLHPEHGYFLSTKKEIILTDGNGKKYKVTVEEIDQ